MKILILFLRQLLVHSLVTKKTLIISRCTVRMRKLTYFIFDPILFNLGRFYMFDLTEGITVAWWIEGCIYKYVSLVYYVVHVYISDIRGTYGHSIHDM
jgi:hypothetical protein